MNEVEGFIGIAVKARHVAFGEGVLKSIQSQHAQLILISEDVGNNARKKLLDKCSFYQVPYLFIEAAILLKASGKINCKYLAITDQGLTQQILDKTRKDG